MLHRRRVGIDLMASDAIVFVGNLPAAGDLLHLLVVHPIQQLGRHQPVFVGDDKRHQRVYLLFVQIERRHAQLVVRFAEPGDDRFAILDGANRLDQIFPAIIDARILQLVFQPRLPRVIDVRPGHLHIF